MTYFAPVGHPAWVATAKVGASKTVENFTVWSVREERNEIDIFLRSRGTCVARVQTGKEIIQMQISEKQRRIWAKGGQFYMRTVSAAANEAGGTAVRSGA